MRTTEVPLHLFIHWHAQNTSLKHTRWHWRKSFNFMKKNPFHILLCKWKIPSAFLFARYDSERKFHFCTLPRFAAWFIEKANDFVWRFYFDESFFIAKSEFHSLKPHSLVLYGDRTYPDPLMMIGCGANVTLLLLLLFVLLRFLLTLDPKGKTIITFDTMTVNFGLVGEVEILAKGLAWGTEGQRYMNYFRRTHRYYHLSEPLLGQEASVSIHSYWLK